MNPPIYFLGHPLEQVQSLELQGLINSHKNFLGRPHSKAGPPKPAAHSASSVNCQVESFLGKSERLSLQGLCP